jgi:acyl-CoA synthetase (AMP-forming)/AMP-acid ligase II
VLHAERPFYPADIRAVLEATPGERILVTTPVHLRALLAEERALAPLRLMLCATAPLSHSLAAEAERRYGAPLMEIYGFTEAGQVAWRRTTAGSEWRTLPGVHPRSDAQGVWFSGAHIGEEALSGDLIELCAADRFILRGRSGDLINVAGKRTSLAYLDHQLAAIEGVEDAAFFVPEDSGESVTRLIAFVVAPGLRRETLLARLRSRIDPAFVPRPLYFVERLPRNATGKLPRRALEALARTCARRGRDGNRNSGSVTRMLAGDHPAAQGHFPGDPIIPGAVILDEVLAAAEGELGSGGCAWTVRHAKFLSPLRPGEALVIRFLRSAGAEVRFECAVGSRAVAAGSLRPGAAEGER